MGQRLGITRNAVLGKAHRLGLPSHVQVKAKQDQPRKKVPKPPKLKDLPPAMPIIDEPPPPEPPFVGIAFDDLQKSSCRYPQGDGPFVFCGQPRFHDGSAYCAHHHRICYLPLSRRPTFIPAPWADYRARGRA